MHRYLHTRVFFYVVVLVLCSVAAILGGFLGKWTLSVDVPTGCIAVGALLLLVAGCFWARKRGVHPLPRAFILWRVLCIAGLCYLACNLAPVPLQLHVCILFSAAFFCVLWALMRQFSLVLLLPFFTLEFAQIASYYQYGTRINSLVVAETLEASEEEILGYLSPGNMFIAAGAVVGSIVLCFILWRILRKQVSSIPLANAGFIFALLASFFSLSIPPSQRNYLWPPGEFYSLTVAWTEALFHNHATIRQVESLPSPTEKPSELRTLHGGEGVVLVVHIGESVRADRMSINGYKRDTTPFLRSCPRLINFPNCISAACDTCQAQIAILTDARRDIYEKDPAMQPHTGSVLDLFAAHGFRVCSFFGRRVATHLKYDRVVRLLTRCGSERHFAPGSPWTSVPQIAHSLHQLPHGQNTLIFINNEGSHTPFSHYDKQHPPFQPADSTFEKPGDNAVCVNNAYDNTVHYTDEFFRRVTQCLAGRPWLYLYISDHGEYLGHDGIWGRAALGESGRDYHSTTGCRVGMFFLYSEEFEQLHPHFAQALLALKSHSQMLVGQEHIFHTLLGIFDLRTPWYNPNLDLSSDSAEPYCATAPTPPSPMPAAPPF